MWLLLLEHFFQPIFIESSLSHGTCLVCEASGHFLIAQMNKTRNVPKLAPQPIQKVLAETLHFNKKSNLFLICFVFCVTFNTICGLLYYCMYIWQYKGTVGCVCSTLYIDEGISCTKCPTLAWGFHVVLIAQFMCEPSQSQPPSMILYTKWCVLNPERVLTSSSIFYYHSIRYHIIM